MRAWQARPKTRSNLPHPYRSTNLAVLGFIVYCLALPFLLLRLGNIIPAPFRTCASSRVFGRPCPLCGLTRGMDALLHARLDEALAWNPLVLPVLVLLVAELAYRALVLTMPVPAAWIRPLTRLDLCFHIALLCVYVAYAAAFFVWT